MNKIIQSSVNTATLSAILTATGKVFVAQEQDNWGENKIRALELTLTTETRGFVLSEPLLKSLSHMSLSEIEQTGQALLTHLKESLGAHCLFNPMYPNFPAQVINASETELLINALTHYMGSWFGLRILPKYEKIARPMMEKIPNPKIIGLCSPDNLHDYVENMITANVSYSVSQRAELTVLAIFLQQQGIFEPLMSKLDIPNKENLAFWGNLHISQSWNFAQAMAHRFATTTDVLRLIAAYSNADTSLAETLRVAKLPRALRKTFLGLLDGICHSSQDKDQVIENLLTYRSEWVRIAHAVHIGEYASKFPTAYEFISKLRGNEKIVTFNTRVEEAYFHGNVQDLITNLQHRPGVFARNLTRLLVTEKATFAKAPASPAKIRALQLKSMKAEIANRVKNNPALDSSIAQQLQGLKLSLKKEETQKEVVPLVQIQAPVSSFSGIFTHDEHTQVIEAFSQVIHKVSTPVLIQVHSHFKHLESKMNLGGRAFMPKGGLSKMFYQSGSVAKYDINECKQLETLVESALLARFAQLPSLGNVYISPELKTQNVPFAMRSASKALKTVARGSSFALEEKNSNLRMFLWWKEPEDNRVDIDLSVSMYGADFESLGHCSYWNLRDQGLTHSGDIVSAPNGACEFIDIDRTKIKDDVAYIAMTLSAYTGQKYCDLPECFAGWMERDNLEEGEIFDARTVQNKIDLSSDTTNIMPIVYDVKNNRMIWIDTSYAKSSIGSNASKNSDAISMILQSWIETKKPTLYDLFEIHAQARGVIVDTPEKAQTVFSVHNGVTPYDFDVITSEYMADPA